MNRIAFAPLVLLPLLALQDPDSLEAGKDIDWHDLATANRLAGETGKPLLIVFR